MQAEQRRPATPKPPKLALAFFRWYCRADRLEELEGDLEEFFHRRIRNGSSLWSARVFYWWKVLRCYRSYAKAKTQNNMTVYPLFRTYFKLAIRHSWRNKWAVLTNIAGLGIALSMCIFLYMMYAYNFEFDTHYKGTEDIYRLHAFTFENNLERRNEISPTALDDVLRNRISGVGEVVSYYALKASVGKDKDFFTQRVAFVSSEFFDVFQQPLWYGSYTPFGEQPVAYISRELAKKYFGDEVALDKELSIYLGGGRKREVIIAGVFDKLPPNRSFYNEIVVHYKEYTDAHDLDVNDWGNHRYVAHYIRASPENLGDIEEAVNTYVSLQNEGHEEQPIIRFELVPFLSPTVANHLLWRSYVGQRVRPSVYVIFTTLIAMVFLIACFNLANSSMAMTAKRLKEIGIRKTLGSMSKQILVQFLFEMGIVCILAFFVAVSLANTTSRTVLGLFEASFLLQDADLTGVILFILLFLLFTTLVAGLFPALYAWRFQPVDIMRRSVRLKGVSWLSKSLSVGQFAFSIAVLTAGVTFSQNKGWLDNMSLGYEQEGIYVLSLKDKAQFTPLKQRVDQLPGIQAAGTAHNIGRWGGGNSNTMRIDTTTHEVRQYVVGEQYMDLMQVDIITGRGFINGSDNDREHTLLVNQEFARQYYGGESPVNEVIWLGDQRRTIVGVTSNIIDDVYADSETAPIIFVLGNDDQMSHLVIKAPPNQMPGLEADLKSIWSELYDLPFEGRSQDSLAMGDAKRDSDNLQKIFLAMALLGGFLSLVGIFSLAKLNVARRVKEITIRKVLGATINELLLAINRSFSITLLTSFLAGSVLGYLISQFVLGMIYKYHIVITPLTSVVNGVVIVSFSVLMITAAVYLPARMNPVHGLREE